MTFPHFVAGGTPTYVRTMSGVGVRGFRPPTCCPLQDRRLADLYQLVYRPGPGAP